MTEPRTTTKLQIMTMEAPSTKSDSVDETMSPTTNLPPITTIPIEVSENTVDTDASTVAMTTDGVAQSTDSVALGVLTTTATTGTPSEESPTSVQSTTIDLVPKNRSHVPVDLDINTVFILTFSVSASALLVSFIAIVISVTIAICTCKNGSKKEKPNTGNDLSKMEEFTKLNDPTRTVASPMGECLLQ